MNVIKIKKNMLLLFTLLLSLSLVSLYILSAIQLDQLKENVLKVEPDTQNVSKPKVRIW